MAVEPEWLIAALVLPLLAIAFVAVAEVSLSAASRSRIRELFASGNQRAKLIDHMLADPARFLSTLLILKSLAFVAAGSMTVCLAMKYRWTDAGVTAAVGLVWLVLLAVQIAGRGWALRRPEAVALTIARGVNFLAAVLTPLSFLLRRLAAMARGDADEVTPESVFLSEDGLRFLIHVGEGEGVIEEDEKQMIAGIFEFGETTVREIMVPRLDIVAMEVDAPLSQALDLIIANGHSRIPIYEESIDHLIGVLYAKDLLLCLRDGNHDTPVRQLLRRAYFVPQSKKLDELFEEMQAQRIHMALAVDEYGGTAGLVTIEDLLEEIVGEIQDEYDSEEPQLKKLAPDTYEFNARYDIDEVSRLIGVDLSAAHESFDTLGGFIYSQLGRVPKQGESILFKDWRFTVLSVDSRRIEQVRVEPGDGSKAEDSEPTQEQSVVGQTEGTGDNPDSGYLQSAA
ncbi:MAG: hemolysin family protein [Caldilineaceae bacterium]|nr:hemolysin family protein [Caldilineaceae bacterium]MCY4092861.1 hemolysin family protein [Caldilineaceae bacterium]MCY4119090.1 hemolysin family protein [Caldilineaceae bacterium]MDE0070532.1 hemolysin family protein [Caldilineaceae bacterium]MDE0181799.1 hemolysin family protein [Caldilineaceae bacterium]